mgnify:CR=1 FL=1|jgi:hypothetical protein
MTVVAASVVTYPVAIHDISYSSQTTPRNTVKATSVVAFIPAIKTISYSSQTTPRSVIKATSTVLYGLLGIHARSAVSQQVNNTPSQVWVG